MEYREADFDFDIRHFAVSHKLTGAVFRFDGYPDPLARTHVRAMWMIENWKQCAPPRGST